MHRLRTRQIHAIESSARSLKEGILQDLFGGNQKPPKRQGNRLNKAQC